MILNSLLLLLPLLSSIDFQSGKQYDKTPMTVKTPGIGLLTNRTIENKRDSLAGAHDNTKRTNGDELVSFAESLQGIPYKYGVSNPKIGFDCSGFISYVFNHFGIRVPRSSREFTYIKREIKLKEAKKGDIILFTGTDSTKRNVGHLGIITSDLGQRHEFIHSTSGKAYSVTKTQLNKYYQGRFVKVIRIFEENET